jgi:hypothetical protein
MKTRTLFLLLTFLVTLPAVTEAQVGSILRNKINKAVNAGAKTVNKEMNNQVDTAVQKGVDNASEKAAKDIENSNQNPEQSSQGGDNSQPGRSGQPGGGFGGLFGSKVDLKYKEEYAFTSRLYMQSETYDKKDVMKIDLYMFYSATSPSVGIETKSLSNNKGESANLASSMVMDGENKCFIMLTDINGMKMGMISAIPDENTVQTQPDGKSAKMMTPPTFKKTGNTRVIAGCRCDEYSYVSPDDNSTGKVWFTKEANLKIDKRGWQNTGMSSYYGYEAFKDGVILANEAYDADGKLKMKAETKEINPDFPHKITVKGYSLRQMNINQGAKK